MKQDPRENPEAPDVPLRAKRRDAAAPAVASTGRLPKAAAPAPRAVVPRAVVPREKPKTLEIKEAPPVARVAEVALIGEWPKCCLFFLKDIL